MQSISFFAILGVAAAIWLLGVVTYLNNWRHKVNRVFGLLCGFTGVYVIINYLADHQQSHALLWVRLTFALAAGMLYLMWLFLNIFPKTTLGREWEYILGGIAGLMTAVSFLPSFVPRVALKPGVSDVVPGPLYNSFVAYLAGILLLVVVVIWLSIRRSSGLDRQRMKYVAMGLVVTASLAALTNLILPLIQGSNNYAVLGSYFMLIFFATSSFSIVRHRLFDVRLIIARSVTYALLLLTVAGLYGFGAFAASAYFFGDSVSKGQQIFNTGLAILLAFTFQPLRRFFEKLTDKIFYRDKYESPEVLNEISQVLASELRLEPLLSSTLRLLCRKMRVHSGQFYVYDQGKIYKIEHFGPLPAKIITPKQLEDFHRHIMLADDLQPGITKAVMDAHGIRASLLLRTKDQFVGYLLLGDKLSGDIYSEQDLRLLEILSSELAVGIANAMSYEKIAQFNATLQGKINAATTDLRQANSNLKAIDQTKDEFISLASHQLRTPLTTIKGYLSMLEEGDAGKITPKQKEFVNFAFMGAERMVRLIADLLNVSRLSSGRFFIENKPTDLNKVIKEEIQQLLPHADGRHIGLQYIAPKHPVPMVELDEDKTRQVIMNFIDNAIFYTRAGSVKVSLASDHSKVRFWVEDTGIGVPKAVQKKLFVKFFRANNAQAMRPDGTGLGLYLAKRVVEQQGGTIIFSSVEGKGSTFGFEIPINVNKRHIPKSTKTLQATKSNQPVSPLG